MALWTNVPSGIVDAMDTEISPRTTNPTHTIKDKVIHAKFQVESIEDAPAHDGESSQSTRLVEQSSQNPEDVAEQERAAEMQMWWDEAIAKNMNLPDGYSQVAVLLVKWADELDELKTKKEVGHRNTVSSERALTKYSGRRTRSCLPRALPLPHGDCRAQR